MFTPQIGGIIRLAWTDPLPKASNLPMRLQNFQREIYGVEGFFDELGAGVKSLAGGEAKMYRGGE